MLSGLESGNPGSVSARQRPSLTFWSLLRKSDKFESFYITLGNFPPFGPKNAFWAPKCTFAPKIASGPKRAPFWLKFHWFYKHPRHGDGKVHFCAKSALWRPESPKMQKSDFGAKKWFLEQKSLFWAPWWPGRKFGYLYVSSWEFQSALFAQNHTFRFWRQKCILGPKCTFGAKSDFWDKSAILSKKCTSEISRTHIQVAKFATWPPWRPKKRFLLQNHFLAPESYFYTFCDFGPQSALFAQKVHFPVPMPRMLINLMEFWLK